MPPTTSSTKLRFRRLREWISGPPTQASLFHYIRAEERAESRTRKMEAGVASLVIHALTVSFAVFFALGKLPAQPTPANGPVVFINTPMRLPSLLGNGLSGGGGGGGGGGKHERLPASGGRLPETSRNQLMAPDPGIPKPLLPSDSPMELEPTVQIPIDFPTDLSLPIGDIASPLGGPPWPGPGSGGGIGNGDGTGVGSGNGPGAGPGENGGSGGGPGGTGSSGGGPGWGSPELKLPEVISKATPHYTEEARRARTEGLVILDVVIRANGTVDGFRVIKGLGYGLDESAITTIANKWRFKPATYRGVPIDFKASIQVTFRLY